MIDFILQGELVRIVEDIATDTTRYVVESGEFLMTVVERNRLFDLSDDALTKGTIPFGSMVLADGEEDMDATVFYHAQVIGTHYDGRYKVYFLNDGSYSLLDRKQVVPLIDASFLSPADAKMFSSCDEFEQFLFKSDLVSPFFVERGRGNAKETNTNIFRREVGDG